LGTIENALTGDDSDFWKKARISVCWESAPASQQMERAWVKDAIEQTWQKYSNLSFTGWRRCTSKGANIRIKVKDIGAKVIRFGDNIDNVRDGMFLNFTFKRWATFCSQYGESYREGCIRANAVHEFGHALGFSHEHNRVEGLPSFCDQETQGTSGGYYITPYDLASVMNYCRTAIKPDGTQERQYIDWQLSALDIIGVQKVYGRADGSWIPRGGSWYVSSGGTEPLSILNFSGRSALGLGDFNGDGYSDVFHANGQRWDVSYGGRTRWKRLKGSKIKISSLRFGDFNGDKKTDVLRSNGTHWYVSWGGKSKWKKIRKSALEAKQLQIADFNGDGKDDVFYANGNIFVD